MPVKYRPAPCTVEELRSVLHYDEFSGEFTWKAASGSRKAGDPAGCLRPDGYKDIQVFGKQRKAHRLAWFLSYAEWPTEEVDHINGRRGDNRLCNLRLASSNENHHNRAAQRNRSGLTGAYQLRGRWVSMIMAHGKTKYLGTFSTKEAAHSAYLAAKTELHPFQPHPRAHLPEDACRS